MDSTTKDGNLSKTISEMNTNLVEGSPYLRYFEFIKQEVIKLEERLELKQVELLKVNMTLEAQISELSKLKMHLQSKDSEIYSLRSRIESHQSENISLRIELKKSEEEKINIREEISKVIPSISIRMDSLLELNQPHGWSINSRNSLENKKSVDKKRITVAVLGMYDVGKSWFCNELTGTKHFTTGFNQRTDGLNIHFPEEDNNLIGVIDTPGSNEAIRVTQEDLVQMITPSQDNQANVEEKNLEKAKKTDVNVEEEYMQRYKLLKNDARILQDLKEKFIAEVSDVLILICNKLSEKEQENIYKVIKHHKQIHEERTKSQKAAGGGAFRDTKLYIVHNYKMLTERAQIENQIQRNLRDSFKVEQILLFSANEKEELKSCNPYMYQDQFGISHLILAAKETNAGNYYNPSTFAFIKQKINVIENRTSANVKKLFLDFCNKNLPKLLKQEEIKLQLNSDESAIIKEGGPNIVLENVRYDEFGNFSLSSAFEPRYSTLEKQLDNKKEITVILEVLDSKYEAELETDEEGYSYLHIYGEKNITSVKDTVATNYSRERGKFSQIVRLSKWKMLGDPRREGPNDGVVRYVFEFSKPGPIPIP